MYGIWMKIYTVQTFYTVPFLPPTLPQGQGHGLKNFMLKFHITVFRSSVFTNPVRIWFIPSMKIQTFTQYHPHPLHDHRTWIFSSAVWSTLRAIAVTQVVHVRVPVTTLKFYAQDCQKFVSRQLLTRKWIRIWTIGTLLYIYPTYYLKSSQIYWSPLMHCIIRCFCLCTHKLSLMYIYMYLSLSSVPKTLFF